MSSQSTGRRRVIIGNRSSAPNLATSSSVGGNQAENSDKYRKRIVVAGIVKRGLLVAVVVSIALVFQYKSSPSAWKNATRSSDFVSKRESTVGNCKLRDYPERRYYGLQNAQQPDFLKTEYIYGELPILLHPVAKTEESSSVTKLCVDQSEWYHPSSKESPLPFADGTNPSILKLVDNPRIDPSIRNLFSGTNNRNATPFYLATICMTNSQCSWMDSPEEIGLFSLSTDQEPSTVRTVLLVLNENFETLEEVTIQTRIDAKFGKPRNRRPIQANNQLQTFALDDARLFTHKGEIWVSYREGKHYGYETQVLNKLHFERVDDERAKALRTSPGGKHLTVTLLASEVETLCCGRNMALIDNVHNGKLQALTWVDPVTVVDVDTHKTDGARPNQRKLKGKPKKSHIHGTNGFMVHLPKTGEYLGIGHFHRPPGRDKNDYARFGHHYTHTFFTIPDKPPAKLKRLSPEFLLPSHAHPKDADIIQFWSGLELVPSKGGDLLALAYGINDCEGAATYLDLETVEGYLREVPEGKEVVDLMMTPL